MLCTVALACVATACSSTSAKPSATGSSTGGAPTAGVTSTPSWPGATATGATTPTMSIGATMPTMPTMPTMSITSPLSQSSSGGISPPHIITSIPATDIHGARVAEVSDVGGESPFASLGYQPPEVAVFADGSVVLDGEMWFHISQSDLSTLLSGLQKDLAGQPAVLTPAGGAAMPDVGDTVLGVQRTGGGYQTVRANALSRRLSGGAYPAPVVAAYNALEAEKTSTASRARAPYIGTAVRLAYECPVSTSTATQFWPDGLPAPTHDRGADCPEMLTVSGGQLDVARQACQIYDSAPQSGSDDAQAVPYLAEGGKGIRTCVWRWALPDEQSH